jgi:hypothetical protein
MKVITHSRRSAKQNHLTGSSGKVTILAATADIRELKGMVPKPALTVSAADMNEAIEHEDGAMR